jgi:glucosylceramidase
MIKHIISLGVFAVLLAGCSGCNGGSTASKTSTPTAVTPTFSPTPGSFTSAQTVAIADSTANAAIYYTTDGSTPTTSSTKYSSPIAISTTTTLNAIAVASGYQNSSIATGSYQINLPATATPTFSPAAGSFTTAQTVSISDATANATIYYTTDGSTPTTSSSVYSTPIAISTTTTLNAIAAASGYASSTMATGSYIFPGSATQVSVVLSTHDQSQLMQSQPNVSFATTTADGGTNTVLVDDTQQYQSMDGFGAAFTDSAAYLLMKVTPASTLPGVLSDLFTRTGDGIGLSFMRNPMGASDLARSVYSFDDMPTGQTDLTLANFSISHDEDYILPLVQQAKALNPQMKLMANPWSPPGWMKDSSTMSPVSMLGGSLLMTAANETAFANYFVKYIQAYEAAGVTIDYISLQNEPEYLTTSYPSMQMHDTAQLPLLQDYVLPALANANLSTKVLVWDHNWDTPTYPEYVLSGLTTQQMTQIAGVAWHGYSGVPGAQQTVQNLFPSIGTWETEHSGGTWVSDQFTSDFLEINNVLRNAAKAYVKWGLALNENLGPDLTQDAGLGGCNTCTPIVTVNSQTGAVTKDIEYYTLGHYSKYVLPGAVRVYSSNTPYISSVAFKNTDGSMALIAFNNASSSQTFQVLWGNEAFSYTLPSYAAATFTWSGNQGAALPIAATAQIQGSSYSSESGIASEATSDSTGAYDLGYIAKGAYVLYQNVDFGNSVSQVSVRSASGGNGGTATFYLDNMSGTPIATVQLPVTGGWQTWKTSTAAVTGASGIHNLYVVFGNGPTNSLANFNWFQFQ